MENVVSWLKPAKTNIVGTVLLLVANWAGGLISRPLVPLIMGGGPADMAGRAAGAFAGRGDAFSGAGSTQFATYGLVSGAVNVVVLALLFYVVLSVVVGMLPKEPEAKPKGRR